MDKGRFSAKHLIVAFITIAFLIALISDARALTSEDLLVVYNENLDDSKSVAEHYTKNRMIPRENIIGVRVPVFETMSRPEYNKSLAEPLKKEIQRLKSKGGSPAVLLVYGIPLRIKTNGRSGDFNAYQALVAGKIEESRKLLIVMLEELNDLIGSNELKIKKEEIKENESFNNLFAKTGAAITVALKYLSSQNNRNVDEFTKLKISSLLIRISGMLPFARDAARKAAMKNGPNGQRGRKSDLAIWYGILKTEKDVSLFNGVLPEEAEKFASSIRMSEGVAGELKFWKNEMTLLDKKEDSASVDSELSMIMREQYRITGWLPNPHHDRYGKFPFITELRNNTIMTARLDGPTPAMAKRLSDDAVEIEKKGLEGVFYIDGRGLKKSGAIGSYSWYDRHLSKLGELVKSKTNLTVVYDDAPDLFPEGSCPDAALYCGWYSLRNYIDSFYWVKGAVGYHVASSEAVTLKTPGSNTWCKRMIEKGVAATIGPVQEPYLQSFPLPDHFFPLLMSGKEPLIKVYFRTIPHVSWRQVLIGDPLYTPFKTNSPMMKDR